MSVSKTSPASPEGDFKVLLQRCQNGLRSVDDFLGQLEFEKWLRIFCYKFDFSIFNGQYGPEDLCQQSHQKVDKSVRTLDPDETPNESAFFGFVKKVVYYTFLDALRSHKHELTRVYEPIDLLPDVAPDPDDGGYYLSRFAKFIETYPKEHQRAVELWLEGCSYREIEETLN